MTKNKLEKHFSKMLIDADYLWGMKLQVNPLAHQVTPADYIISSKINPKFILVECKLVTCSDKKQPRLIFKRLKQMERLLAFDAIAEHHYSYFCIAFWKGRWTKSEIYLIRAKDLQTYINNHYLLSTNQRDLEKVFQSKKIINLRRLE